MKESSGKTSVMSKEYLNETIMKHVVNKWWYKFCYGIFTDEQYEQFLRDIEFYDLDLNLVVAQILCKKRDTHKAVFKLEKR